MDVPPFSVKKGDVIDFVVHCNKDENSDAFAWAPTLNLKAPPLNLKAPTVSLKNATYSAERDFAGPPPTTIPLTRWERYIQAVLLTNEFFFID